MRPLKTALVRLFHFLVQNVSRIIFHWG